MSTPIFIVNLKQSTDRRQWIANQCHNLNLHPTFIEAVDGRSLSADERNRHCNKEKAQAYMNRQLTPSEIGCALSHKKIWQHLIEHNIPQALILEDDAVLDKQLLDVLNLEKMFPPNWDILLLGHYNNCFNQQEMISPISFWGRYKLNPLFSFGRLCDHGYGTHGYLISLQGAQKLEQLTKTLYMPLDHYTNSAQMVNVYALTPTVISVQLGFPSMIEDERQQLRKKPVNFQIKPKEKLLRWLRLKILMFKRMRAYD